MFVVLVFALSAAAILYILFLYPAVVIIMARLRPNPVRRAPLEKRVTVVMAVHNGARFLRAKLDSLLALNYPRELTDVIAVSDGSTDETDAIAREYEDRGVRLIRVPKGGKPAALNAGIAAADGEILLFTDVRQELDRGALRYLLENFADERVGCCSGRLVIRKGASLEEENVGLYWRYEFAIRNALASLDSIFGATGALYAMRRELAGPIPADALNDDMHLPLLAFFRGRRLAVDDRARIYDYPIGLESEFRRKVRTLAGNYQIVREFPALLGPANRMWIHYVSYKFGRLLLPLFLLATLVSGVFLPAPFDWIATAGQLAFYLAAACDPWLPRPLKKLSSPVRIFTVMMLATLAASSILFRPASSFWKETKVREAV